MARDSLKRLDRIVAILIQLQSKRVITAQELAERYEVSIRTIYRDIRSLEAAGIPLVSEAGIGYSLMEGYRLPPVAFTQEEVTSFVAAEKLVHHYMDKNISFQFSAVMNKLKALLRWSEKDRISSLESNVLIRPGSSIFNKDVPHAMSVLMASISEKKQVDLRYRAVNGSGVNSRRIEPVGVFQENRYWYVMGYCHLRKAYRQFRTDRVENIQLSPEDFELEHPPLSNFLEKNLKETTVKVVIRLQSQVARYLNYDKAYYGFQSEKQLGEEVEWTFNTGIPEEGFARWFLMFADKATIVSPDRVKTRIRQLLNQASKNLE